MKSQKSYTTIAAQSAAAPQMGGNRQVKGSSIPCNTGADDELAPQFNSIGYYASLLNRLNDQIETVEDVYKKSFVVARSQ